MKIFILFLVAMTIACGAPKSTTASKSPTVPTPAPGAPAMNTYEIHISGDGTASSISMITESEQLALAPQTVPAGQTLIFTVHGYATSNLGISRTAGTVNQFIQVFKNGEAGEFCTLTTNGTYVTLNNW